jgi:hypothetical protein
MRTMAVFFMAEEDQAWAWNETWVQTAMLGIGATGLFVLGIFPQVMQPFIAGLPSLFEHLSQ